MPHVPLLQVTPEPSTQETDQETTDVSENDDAANGQSDGDANVNNNTACEHDADISHFKFCFCIKRTFFSAKKVR